MDGGGRRDVEGIGAKRRRHGDRHATIAARDGSGRQAGSLGAEEEGPAGGRGEAGQGCRVGSDDGGDGGEAGRAEIIEIVGPVGEARDGQREDAAERDADGLAVEGIGAAGRQTERVGAERDGVAHDAAEVVDVGEILEDDDAACGVGQWARRGPLADGQAAAMDVEPGDGVHHGLRRDEHGKRRRCAERVLERVQAWRRREHGAHVQTAREQPAHDALALGDEAPARGVEVTLLELAVVGEPRVVRVGHLDVRRAHARSISEGARRRAPRRNYRGRDRTAPDMTWTPTSSRARRAWPGRRPGRARARGRAVGVSVAALVAVAAACSGPQDPHGSPVLTQVYWVAGATQYLAWSSTPDQIATSVPPFGSEVDFVFDRRLDGDRIEDTVIVDGAVTTRSAAIPPITAQWPGMAEMMSDPPFVLTVQYNSEPRFGGASSYVFAQPAIPGFPSSETVTFDLDLSKLTSAYDEPATAPTQIPVVTSPFSVAIATPAAGVPGSYALPLAFSNRLPLVPAAGTSPFVHVARAGAEVPYKLLVDPTQASIWYVAPADCLGVWPAGATLDVTVDAGLPDAFGGKLAQAATASFVTGAGARASAAADASCAVGPAPQSDAATTEGGMADAAPDANGSADADAGLDLAEAADGGATPPDGPDAAD